MSGSDRRQQQRKCRHRRRDRRAAGGGKRRRRRHRHDKARRGEPERSQRRLLRAAEPAGDVELDASIMIGRGLRSGAVGALQGYQDAIELARRVMDELPHAMIAGPGAARLAAEVGLPASRTSSPRRPKHLAGADRSKRARKAPTSTGSARSSGRDQRPAVPRAAPRNRQRHRPRPRRVDRMRRQHLRVGLEVPRPPGRLPGRSAPATTPTIAGAPPPAPAVARWPQRAAPPTRW